MQIYYVIHIMKLVKILIIIVIRKNLLSVEYVLFLYFYVILIFFEKTRNIVYIYIYVSIEWDSEFGVTRLQEVWKSFQRKSLKLLSKDNKKFKKRNLSFQSHDEKFFSLKVNKKNILMPRSFLLSHSHLFTEIQKINWENFFFHLIQSSK